MHTDSLPLAITMGDPSGIGPEIIAKTLSTGTDLPRCIVIGDPLVIETALQQYAPGMTLRVIDTPAVARFEANTVELLSQSKSKRATERTALPAMGEISAASGQAAFDAITTAIDWAQKKEIAGIVTAPIHKEALAQAGIKFPGHTEILAHYSGAQNVAMMLTNDVLRTVLVTVHCALREALEQADFNAQIAAIRLADSGTRALGIVRPRVAVAGLNPHAGEGGLFGDEEQRIIGPAIQAARDEGIDVSGPWPGDTVFMQARQGQFDVVVAQYHDQGLIPIKYLGLADGVNITLGLPFVRTSPDHGTAFDIAGRGVADPASLHCAVQQAALLVKARRGLALRATAAF